MKANQYIGPLVHSETIPINRVRCYLDYKGKEYAQSIELVGKPEIDLKNMEMLIKTLFATMASIDQLEHLKK